MKNTKMIKTIIILCFVVLFILTAILTGIVRKEKKKSLNEQAQNQVVAYMQSVGDSKKDERESLGLWIMGYFLILGILAILWKNKVWRNLH